MMRCYQHLSSGRAAARIGATCLVVVLCVSGLTTAPCEASDLVFSSNARFRIPYQLDAAEIHRLRATEIQLHVSTDQGKNWRNVDSVPPVAGKFTFEAAQDGEYWFSVRTISEDGRHHPSGALAAGLKVHVDTELPTLDLELSEAKAGQIGLRWSAADDHLSADSLSIEYRISSDAPWETVQIAAVSAGETSWPVPQGGNVIVRGYVQDRAGNEATAQDELTIAAPVSTPAPAAPAPARHSRQPIAEGALPTETSPLTDPLAASADQQPASVWDPARPSTLPVINPYSSDYSQFVSQREASPAPATQPTAPSEPTAEQSSIPSGAPEAGPPAAETLPSDNSAPRRHTTPQSPLPQSLTSQHPGLRRVNSTNFQIGYALEDVGPSGVSSVDLFLTEDGGRKWFHYGSDDDATSPFEVTVPADGAYGFAIRVRSGVGLSQAPPQPGEAPEMTIAVDRQPPQVTLMPLKQGHGPQPGQLLIEWSITRDELAERPISLSYATQPGGPWQPISGAEPNTGRYLWNFGPDVPPQVYVRVEARDAAGNIGRADSRNPLVIDLSRPSARFIEVEPIPIRN